MGLPGSLAQRNVEINQFLIKSLPDASEFHKIHHVISKGLNFFPITWQKVREIRRKYPTCFLYNQTPLPARSNPMEWILKGVKSARWRCAVS